MTYDDRDIHRLLKHLDGELPADERAKLNASLRANPALREAVADLALAATVVADAHRVTRLSNPVANPTPKRGSGRPWLMAASVLLAVLLGTLWFRSKRPTVPVTIATLTQTSGTVSWTAAGQHHAANAAAGDRLTAGTLETELESGSAQVRFADGTTLTLGGGSELTVSDDGQKSVRLERGSVSASVAKQAAGKPMVLLTPTARLEVLGTVFSVTAQTEHTLLNVAEGHVRLKRLADGREVVVGGSEAAVASLDSGGVLAAKTPSAPPANWRLTFPAPSALHRGDWRAADPSNGMPARLAAVPYVAGKRDNGDLVVHRGVFVGAGPEEHGGAVATLRSDSAVRLRYHTKGPAAIQLILVTRHADGSFAGNFEAWIRAEPPAITIGPDGWRVADVPLTSTKPITAGYPVYDGCEVTKVLVSSYAFDAQLELAEVWISTPASH